MHATFEKDDGTLVSIYDAENEVSTEDRTFYFVGTIEGLIQSDYAVQYGVNLDKIVHDLPNNIPRISGQYAGLSIRDGIFECAASDVSAVKELYYTTTDEEIILSTDLVELARSKGKLEYDIPELLFFVRDGFYGFCRKGRTTFKDVRRLPPGEKLLLSHGKLTPQHYLSQFSGVPVSYIVFKKALSHSVRSTIQYDPSYEEIIMFSGGVDSSVMLSLVKDLKDVTAVTYRFVPPLSNWNEPDGPRAKKMAKKLQVEQDIIDVDLNKIHLKQIHDVIISMPFAAHLSVYYTRIFETQYNKNKKKRLWCGQNLDTLYNYTVTHNLNIINRFLLSNTYVRMLGGVKSARKFMLVKKALDTILKGGCRALYERAFDTPNTISELIEFFNESDKFLALKEIEKENEYRVERIDTPEIITADEIRKVLFDERLGSFFTGGGHKIQLQAKNLFHTQIVLPYSTPNIIHMLRNLNLTMSDVVKPKRYMYGYARELGFSRHDFQEGGHIRKPSITRPRASLPRWLNAFYATVFGAELKQAAESEAKNMGIVLNAFDRNRWLKEVGIVWVSHVHNELIDAGIELRWPKYEDTRMSV